MRRPFNVCWIGEAEPGTVVERDWYVVEAESGEAAAEETIRRFGGGYAFAEARRLGRDGSETYCPHHRDSGYAKLKRQRDALLEALKNAVQSLETDGPESASASLRTTGRAAIAACEVGS